MAVAPTEQQAHDALLEGVLRAERDHLMRWCMRLTGDAVVAEDLVQETLAAAWKSRRRPSRTEEYPAWLAGIARNMCRSWLRQQKREGARTIHVGSNEEPFGEADIPLADSTADIELVLEREELALLLDRALAHIPADTREALIWRYIEESPLAEVAARLGASSGAVAARLHRGKLALRQVLATTLRDEAATYGLVRGDGNTWQQTRIWCPSCGAARFLGRMVPEHGALTLRCPSCSEGSRANFASWADPSLFAGLTSYRAALSRLSRFGHRYFRTGLSAGRAPCAHCGRLATVRRAREQDLPRFANEIAGMVTECADCHTSWITGLNGLTLCHPRVQQFWRAHPRIMTQPTREVEIAGRLLLLSRFVATTETAHLDVLSDPTSLDVIAIEELAGHA